MFAGDFPPDIRVEKEARALHAAGHDVTIVCRSLHGRPARDRWQGCLIVRLSERGGALARAARSLAFRDPWWERELRRLVRELSVDVLHVHDLPLLGSALRVGPPVVADFHENYPASIVAHRREGSRLGAATLSLVSGRRRWERYERRAARRAARVLVVVDEARERLAAAGLDPARIAVVENTEEVERFLALPVEPVEGLEGRLVISYVGGFGGSHRGLDTAVAALPLVAAELPEVLLLLVGDGPARPALERLARELGVAERVRFLPWQPFERVPSLIAASDICLVPHRSNPHTEATSPHKLFQYMLLARPVVVSSCRPLARVIESTGAGLVFKAGDAAALARAILLLRDPDLREQLGAAGRRAVLERYNWETTSRVLTGVYEGLARG